MCCLNILITMKNIIKTSILTAFAFGSFTLLCVAYPRPSFVPSTPHSDKNVNTYSAAELYGAIVTSDLPNNHKFNDVVKLESLKSCWPEAKEPTKIDEMVQIILDAPATTKSHELDIAFENIIFVMQKVMAVSDTEKADAFVRIVAAQTEPLKIKRARKYASRMFYWLYDARLLNYRKEDLDDATEYTEEHTMAEGTPRRKSSIRADARMSLLSTLRETLKINIDQTPFTTPDEAGNCAALKAWLTANWTQVVNKCAEVKADPETIFSETSFSPWDARWE